MEVGLLEGIMGRFISSDLPISTVSENQHRLISIKEHLSALFNTRRGSIGHLPDYGLPDISVICDKMPDSVEMLRKAIKETVEKYEPRLTDVKVIERKSMDENSKVFSVSFDLIAQVVAGPTAYFRARFSTMGPAEVKTLQRRH